MRATPSEANNPIIVLQSDVNDLEVLYDGKNAKVAVGGQYQGRTCGLCGDNNDESEEEFAGPDTCVYDSSEDFANSYALSGQHCEQRPRPEGPKRCPNGQTYDSEEQIYKKTIAAQSGPNGQSVVVRQEIQNPEQRAQQIQSQANIEELQTNQQQMAERQMARQGGQPVSAQQQQSLVGGNKQQQELIQRLRTQYIERDEMICFSTKPLLTCIDGVSRASGQLREAKTDFHCLPKSSPFTQQLILESHKSVIKQLANKRVDIRQVIQVPQQCVAL